MSRRFMTVDVETMGLGKFANRVDAVYEIGAVIINSNGEQLSNYRSLCYPGDDFFHDDRAAGALKDSPHRLGDIRKALPCDAIAERWKRWLLKYLPMTVLMYNRNFDADFLSQPPWDIHLIDGLELGPCVMRHCARYLGERGKNTWSAYHDDWKWPKLKDAAEMLDIDVTESRLHGALYDAELTAKIAWRTGMLD